MDHMIIGKSYSLSFLLAHYGFIVPSNPFNRVCLDEEMRHYVHEHQHIKMMKSLGLIGYIMLTIATFISLEEILVIVSSIVCVLYSVLKLALNLGLIYKKE